MAGTNPQHRVLVVGAGSIGERHIRCFLATGRCEVSCLEIDDTVRLAVSIRNGIRGFADLKSALASQPSIAVVATPAHLHIEIAASIVKQGIHVLIEKPLATNESGISELLSIIQKRKVVAGVAYVYRSHPVLANMRQAILSGRFGRPVQIVVVAGQHFPTYRPAYQHIYYRDRATGGGAIQDALTHLINAGEWLVGPVTRLVADAAHQVLPGVDVEDTVHVLARHGSVLGSYSLNQHQAPNETTITVICEAGTHCFQVQESRWRSMIAPGGAWSQGMTQALERDELFSRQANLFLDAMDRRQPPLCSLEEGWQSLRVNLAALASLESRNWMDVSQEADK